MSAFKYPGSCLHKRGDLEWEVQGWLQGSGNEWRKVSGVISERKMLMRLKSQVHKTMIRPVSLYGTETWATKEQQVKKLMAVEMRCLWEISEVTRRDRMRNEDMEKKGGQLREKIQESRPRCFGHVKRQNEDDMIRWAAEIVDPGRRPKGRSRKRWMDCVKEGGKVVDLNVVEDRVRSNTITRRSGTTSRQQPVMGQTGRWWWLLLCF